MGDRVPREINPEPRKITGRYGKGKEETIRAIDLNEGHFVASEKHIMPGI